MADPTPEGELPISQRLDPRTPSPDDPEPRSEIYSPGKLANDYAFFMKHDEPENFDPNKPLPQKQRELFHLYEEDKVTDAIQAWEWFLGRKWSEFDKEEKELVYSNLNDDEKSEFGHLLGHGSFNVRR